MNQTKRRGRPRVKRRRIMMALRVTPELHDRILARVDVTGRSITQEMELLIEQSLRDEDRAELFHDAVYGRQTAGLLEAFGRTIRDTIILASSSPASPMQSDWLSDPRVFASVEAAVANIFDRLRPAGDGVQVSRPDPFGPSPVGPGVADGILQDIAYGAADSAADHARLGARLREKLGPEATQCLRAALEQAQQPEANQ
jgi:hypothetical protein